MIKDSNFSENYSGRQGASVNLRHIKQSTVEFQNCKFIKNTGSYAHFEGSLPFQKYLWKGQHKLNWYNPTQEQLPNTLIQKQFDLKTSTRFLVNYPTMRGTIYSDSVDFLNI